MNEKQDLIKHYFKLANYIYRARERISNVKYSFYDRSFHTRVSPMNNDLTVIGGAFENEVVEMLDCVINIEKSIKEHEYRLKHLYIFIKGLSLDEQQYLINKYVKGQRLHNDQLDTVTSDYIKEIEESINLKYGYVQTLAKPAKTENLKHDIKNLINVLEGAI